MRSDSGHQEADLTVLHVHGYNDYFFHTHFAKVITDAGHGFFAVDLPRCGRSRRQGDIAHELSDLSEYSEVISAAVDAIRALNPGTSVVVHGHSLGGLATAVWAMTEGRKKAQGLVLNAPLFGLHMNPVEKLSMFAVPLLAAINPRLIVNPAPSPYATAIHSSNGGAWDFDPQWKSLAGVPARAAWLNAVLKGWRIIRRETISVPTLVACSDSSGPDDPTRPEHSKQDTVVDVSAIKKLGPKLGPHVEMLIVQGALHDLTLSAPQPRAEYFAALLRWLDSLEL